VPLEASRVGAHSGVKRVEVGLTEGHRLSFEQFNPRAPSTLGKKKKKKAEMVDDTPGAVALKPVTKEK
jgi:hypothetical protein